MDEFSAASHREVARLQSRIEKQLERRRPEKSRLAEFARKQIEGKAMMPRISERMRMAENLFAIIAEARSKGTKKRVIASAAGMADQNGKSSALYQYQLDSVLPQQVKDVRAKRLVQHTGGYLRLAIAAAREAELDLDDVILRLVEGTRFAEGLHDLEDDIVPEHFMMLADIIREQARQIVGRTGLDWYFRTIDEQGLTPSGDGWGADQDAETWIFLSVPRINLLTEEVACFAGRWRPKGDKNG
jgi:hypothetical protein